MAPALIAYNLPRLVEYIAISVWGCCFICVVGMPRPENWIKQIQSPHLLYLNFNRFYRGLKKHKTHSKMKHLLKVSMLISLLFASVNVFGQSAVERFEVNGLYYSFKSKTDKTVYVTYDNSNYSSGGYYKGVTHITIPSSIYYSGDYYSVIGIGNSAFSHCETLKSVTILAPITYIGYSAFYYTGITSIEIPTTVKTIGDDTFKSCDYLTDVIISGDVSMGDGVFDGCDQLTNIEFKGQISGTIGNYTFCNCSSLKSISISGPVTEIGKNAFYYCNNLTSINLPNSIKTIGDYAFYSCEKLLSFSAPSNLSTIGESAFNYCRELNTFVFNSDITVIPTKTFYRCYSLTNIILPNSITTIGDSSFEDCSSLSSLDLPTNLKTIGNNTFSGCTKLKSLFIPTSLSRIGNNAFLNCSSLNEIIYTSSNAPQNWIATTNTYVPSLTNYSTPPQSINNATVTELITWSDNTFVYNIGKPNITWTNNLKGYNATLIVPELESSIGKHNALIPCTFYNSSKSFEIKIPYTYEIISDDTQITIKDSEKGILTLFTKIGACEKFKFEAAEGWTINSVIFNNTDVTDQLSDIGEYTTPTIQNISTINISYKQDVTSTQAIDSNQVKVYGYDGNLFIQGTNDGSLVEIIDINGISYSEFCHGTLNVKLPSNNIYIIKVEGNTYKIAL